MPIKLKLNGGKDIRYLKRYINFSKIRFNEIRKSPYHTSNMASVRILSKIDLKPRAPVLFAIAFFAIIFNALSVK